MRVLFVDDEPLMLAGLRRMLHATARDWEMAFVDGAKAALEELARQPYDIVVSDLRMPIVDGAELLRRVKNDYPGTIRIALTGYADRDTGTRVATVAHQFQVKPVDGPQLKELLERAYNLRALLDDPELRTVVAGMGRLPARPSLYGELMELLSDPRASIREIAAIVSSEPAVAAKVLQLVNSALFGPGQRITHIERAVTTVGYRMLADLMLSESIFRSLQEAGQILRLKQERRHATVAARLGRAILGDSRLAEDAFTAGLLHNVGRLILASYDPEALHLVQERIARGEAPATQVERDVIGVTHGAIGAYLLGLWGISYPIVEAVAHHQEPQVLRYPTFGVLGATHVACALATESGRKPGSPRTATDLDMDYLEAHGVASDVDEWRELAIEIAAAGEAGS